MYVCMYMHACIHGCRDCLGNVASWFTDVYAAGLGNLAKMIHDFYCRGLRESVSL